MCNTFIETFYNIPKYDEVSDSSINGQPKKKTKKQTNQKHQPKTKQKTINHTGQSDMET